MKQTLKRTDIIKSKTIFQRVYKKGRSFASRYVVLYVMRRDDMENEAEPKRKMNDKDRAVGHAGHTNRTDHTDHTMVGFAAGKKLGHAVTRHRLKRIMRESFRHQKNNIKDGYYMLMVARKAAVDVKQPVMEKALVELLSRAKSFKKN